MGILSLVFGLILSFVSVQSQTRDDLDVFVSVHGALLRKKLIILYHDEITYNGTSPTLETTESQGDVACFGNVDKVRWRSPSGRFLATEEEANYRQIESAPGYEIGRFRISQLITPTDGASPTGGGGVIVNGLWICQVDNSDYNDEDILHQFNYVGIYTRESTYDRGAIIVNTVTLVKQFNFGSDPPTFILAGDTRGGPPVTNSWTRNGIKLRNNLETHISLGVHGVNTLDVESVSHVLQESRYRSTLTVTGYLPGVYAYSVTNQAMIETLTASFTIYGGLLTNLTAEQFSLTAVFVSWIAAYDISEHEFNLMVYFPGGSTETFSGESLSFIFYSTVPGVHTIKELYPEHYPVTETMVTVKGHGPATMSVSQSRLFVNITFIPPEFSLPVIQYMVTLSRVTVTGSGLSGQELCPEFVHNRPAEYTSDSSISFTDLEAFSTYTVKLITTFNVFIEEIVETTPEMRLTTLSAAPDGVPRDVDVLFTTSRRFMVSWDTIECIERNGIILRYVVDSNAAGSISGMTYSAERLTPGIQYTFRVAGVNDADRGPFTDTMTITTNEEVPGRVADFTALGKFTTVDLTWSAPQEPNGVIISYEVTYRINNGTLNTIKITASSTTFSIKSLLPQTNVSGLSIRAYTKIGPGGAITTANRTTLENSTVINVDVEILSATAVMVSWDKVDIPEIVGYIVYYNVIDTGIRNTQSINVTRSVTSVEIEGLLNYADYQFQVAVIAEVDGVKFIGEIEKISLETESTLEVILGLCTRNCEIVVGVVFCYFVIMILVTILLVLYYRHRTYRLKYTSKSRSERVGSSSIYKKDFKIDTDETLEYDQKPDINQSEKIDIKNDADETLERDQNQDNNQLQTTDIKIDETLECDQNIDINQLKKSDFQTDADEALEYSQNSDNQQQTIDFRIESLDYDQNQNLVIAQLQTTDTDFNSDANETLEQDQNPDINQQQTDNDSNKTLEHDQNPDINQQQTDNDSNETLEHDQNPDINQQQTDNETLEHDQNPDINQQQTDIETLEHDQNPDNNQQQTTNLEIDPDEIEHDQNLDAQTTDSEIECAETLEHDQNQDVEDDHNDD